VTGKLLSTKVALLMDAQLGVGKAYMLDFAEVYCEGWV
jgi:hypothetical protein